ncbi:hypothetical protein F4818DRAFT_432509 [Hypoxylon cercidicola]|nr:hypothetical protein F4818DRAFT_432509 [Hypoxylon cercidicola]
MESPSSKSGISVASQSVHRAQQKPVATSIASEPELPPPYASHDYVRRDSDLATLEQPYVSQSHPLLEFPASGDGYAPPEAMRAVPKRDYGESCCCSTTGGCFCSSNGACCCSNYEGCCFSDHEACCFSNNKGCCFSDNGGCCFSNHPGSCCFSGWW